ncbi:MAG: universal stress protein [bacterium]|nr:universal stress protein [bacterium]
MKKLLVPIDFQNTTLNALKYSVRIAKEFDFEIHALHLIGAADEKAKAEKKMEEVVKNFEESDRKRITPHITVGKIESDIGKTAESLEVSFILMGIHKKSRLDKIFGSRPIKVISESKTPYITIQEGGTLMPISKIAMTIDLEKESIQIVEAAIDLAKLFGAEIILVGGDHTDSTLKSKVAVNVKTTRRLLSESGISSSVKLLDRSHFMENFIDFCAENKVNLIAATYYPDTFTVFSNKFVQRLMENEACIPVLTLDSQSVGKLGKYSF